MRIWLLFGLFMNDMFATMSTIFAHLQAFLRTFTLVRKIVDALASRAFQFNTTFSFSHMILLSRGKSSRLSRERFL